MTADNLLGFTLARVVGSAAVFGYAVACPTFCSTNIVDKCTTFGTTYPVQHIATCTSNWRRNWPCFTSSRRCMAGHVVRTGGAHCTKRTTSQAAVKAIMSLCQNVNMSIFQYVNMSVCQNATFQFRYQNKSCSEYHHDVR